MSDEVKKIGDQLTSENFICTVKVYRCHHVMICLVLFVDTKIRRRYRVYMHEFNNR